MIRELEANLTSERRQRSNAELQSKQDLTVLETELTLAKTELSIAQMQQSLNDSTRSSRTSLLQPSGDEQKTVADRRDSVKHGQAPQRGPSRERLSAADELGDLLNKMK